MGLIWSRMRKPRSEYPSEQADKFLLRLPDGMRDMLKAAAEANNRSINAEIVTRLSLSFKEEGAWRRNQEEHNATAQFVSALMEAMHYGKKLGRSVKVEVSVPEDLKGDAGTGGVGGFTGDPFTDKGIVHKE